MQTPLEKSKWEIDLKQLTNLNVYKCGMCLEVYNFEPWQKLRIQHGYSIVEKCECCKEPIDLNRYVQNIGIRTLKR